MGTGRLRTGRLGTGRAGWGRDGPAGDEPAWDGPVGRAGWAGHRAGPEGGSAGEGRCLNIAADGADVVDMRHRLDVGYQLPHTVGMVNKPETLRSIWVYQPCLPPRHVSAPGRRRECTRSPPTPHPPTSRRPRSRSAACASRVGRRARATRASGHDETRTGEAIESASSPCPSRVGPQATGDTRALPRRPPRARCAARHALARRRTPRSRAAPAPIPRELRNVRHAARARRHASRSQLGARSQARSHGKPARAASTQACTHAHERTSARTRTDGHPCAPKH